MPRTDVSFGSSCATKAHRAHNHLRTLTWKADLRHAQLATAEFGRHATRPQTILGGAKPSAPLDQEELDHDGQTESVPQGDSGSGTPRERPTTDHLRERGVQPFSLESIPLLGARSWWTAQDLPTHARSMVVDTESGIAERCRVETAARFAARVNHPALFSWVGGWCKRTCVPSAGNVTRTRLTASAEWQEDALLNVIYSAIALLICDALAFETKNRLSSFSLNR